MQTKDTVFKLTIHRDHDAESPRTAFDNAATLYIRTTAHYSGGDEHAEDPIKLRCADCGEDIGTLQNNYGCDCDDPMGDVAFTDYPVCIPLYRNVHEELSPGDNLDVSDPEPDGWIYMAQETVNEEWGGDVAAAERYARGEVEDYNVWLRGAYWGYMLWEVTECTCCGTETRNKVDAVWGFAGDLTWDANDALRVMMEYLREHVKDDDQLITLLDEAADTPNYS